jgi:hypothetical protein
MYPLQRASQHQSVTPSSAQTKVVSAFNSSVSACIYDILIHQTYSVKNSIGECFVEMKQDMQCTYNVTLRRVRVTTVVVEYQ